MGQVKPEQIREEAIRAAVSRLLGSPEFVQSERMRKLLAYLVDSVLAGRAGQIKESVIAVEVFGRDPGYDPKIDGIVRTAALRLRQKLQEYYAGTGLHETVRIDLPKGGYIPVFLETAMAPAPILERKRAWPKIAVGCLVAAAIFGVLVARNREVGLPPVPRKFTTGSGNARSPMFSPDGRQLAYSVDKDGTSRIMVSTLSVSAADGLPWTDGQSMDYEPTWSPDGKRIAFLRVLPSFRFELRIATAPNQSVRVGEISGRDGIDWSPDGKWIAVADQVAPDAPKSIFLVDAESGAKRQVTIPPMGTLGDVRPRFSPDGTRLSFLRAVADGAEDVYLMDLGKGGAPHAVTTDSRAIGSYAWMPSGDELLIAVSRRDTAQSLWRVKLSDGSLRRVAEAGVGCLTPAMSPKGGRIAWATIVQDTNIWRLMLDGSAPDRKVVTSTAADTAPQISPDGQLLAFRSARTGFSEIWVSDIEGEHARQLTVMKGPGTISPRWSPDGRYLLFDSRVTGHANLYKIAGAGGTAVRLTSGNLNETVPSWSRDGRSIYFASDRSGRSQIFRMPADGGTAEPLTREGGGASFESPDGFLYYARGPQSPGLWRIALGRAAAVEEAVIPELDKSMWGNWAVGSTGVYYTRRAPGGPPEHWQIAFLSFATGQTRVIRELERNPVLYENGLVLSPDEKALYFTMLDFSSSDIYLMDGVR